MKYLLIVIVALPVLAAGYAIYMAGLPPVCYGAGLNLFYNKFLGFFMNRLGAYKVDRRKKHSLYKNVLKEYAAVSMELGYDNLFFPGGTRSRLSPGIKTEARG